MSSQLPLPYAINIHIAPYDNAQVTLHNDFSFNFQQPTQHTNLVEEELTETEYRISEDGEPIDVIRSRSVTRPSPQTSNSQTQAQTQTSSMSQLHASANQIASQISRQLQRQSQPRTNTSIPVTQTTMSPNNVPATQTTTTTTTLPESSPASQTTTTTTPGNTSLPPGLFGNRRVNFRDPSNNSQSMVELFTFAPTNGNNVNPTDFTNQLNNMTNGLVNLFSGNSNAAMPNIGGSFSGRSGGLNLNDLRQYTTLSIRNNETNNNNETSDHNGDNNENDNGTNAETISNCEICHDAINNGDIIRIINICNHSFHQECIDAWLENNNTCPYCRGNVLNQTPIDVHSETIDDLGTVNTTSETTDSSNNNDNATENGDENEHMAEI